MYIHHFSISPYSVEIIELSVFFREQMHDNILIVLFHLYKQLHS